MENPDSALQESLEDGAIETAKFGDLPEGLVLVSSGSEDGPPDDEQEEGEIQDDDDEQEEEEEEEEIQYEQRRARVQLDLEDISSEEESNIRERMAVLEAMDKEVGLIKKISGRSSYDYLPSENYYYYYHPKHRNHKSIAADKKQDNRDAHKRERLIPAKRHHEKTKEKPKRSSHKKHKKRRHASSSPSPLRRLISSDSESELFVNREILKIACSTDNRRKRGSSYAHVNHKNTLKKKLLVAASSSRREKERRRPSGKLKERNSRIAEQVVQMIVDSSSSEHENGLEEDEEEEEELQLRLHALSTKPIVKDTDLGELISEFQVPSPPPPPSMNLSVSDEQAAAESHADTLEPEKCGMEERELRLIALKSAVMKKHESRLKRKEAERPYSPSDDVVLSPVREAPPAYDEHDNELYSDGKVSSVEVIEDDNDVQIIENPCELIALDDTDVEEGEQEEEVGGNDMEISSVESSNLVARPFVNACDTNDMTEESQQPIDMELASSENSTDQFPDRLPKEIIYDRPALNGIDSELFTRRENIPPQSPPMTPDSMDEAEAEALRHLLLKKMRQKKSHPVMQPQFDEGLLTKDSEVAAGSEKYDVLAKSAEPSEEELVHTIPEEASVAVHFVEQPRIVEEEGPSMLERHEISESFSQTATQTVNSNLITLVNRSGGRKRRKKSVKLSAASEAIIPGTSSVQTVSTPLPDPLMSLTVHTQKLVNNPNKLINLQQTISPSSPSLPSALMLRTDSPKEATSVDTFVSKPVAKLVIQLGNSDSDSDVDFGCPSPAKRRGEIPSAASSSTPGVKFEEQLDKFLKSVRSKISVSPDAANTKDLEATDEAKNEQTSRQPLAKASAMKSQSVSLVGNSLTTSAAVKHLPRSAQMEYARLVARMAQLERHKLVRQRSTSEKLSTDLTTVEDNTSTREGNKSPNTHEEATVTPSDASDQEQMSTKSPGRRKQVPSESQSIKASAVATIATFQDPVEKKIQQIRSSLPNLSELSRNRLLLTAEKQLERHSGTFLHELQLHNATICEAQQERRELYQLDSRIELLKEKLAILERAREQHRQRSQSTFTSLQTSHRKIVSSRKRATEMERICREIGHAVVGDKYQLPTSSSGPVLQEQLKILTSETRQLKAIRKPTLEEFKQQMLAKHRQKLLESASLSPEEQTRPENETYPENDDSGEVEHNPTTTEAPVPEPSAGVVAEELAPDQHEMHEAMNDAQPEGAVVGVEEKFQMEATILEDQTMETAESNGQSEDICLATVTPRVMVEETGEPSSVGSGQDEVPIPATGNDLPNGISSWDQPVNSSPTKEADSEPEKPVSNGLTAFGKYTSPLLSLKQGEQHIPNGILCPYELSGQCVDRECKFEHFSQR